MDLPRTLPARLLALSLLAAALGSFSCRGTVLAPGDSPPPVAPQSGDGDLLLRPSMLADDVPLIEKVEAEQVGSDLRVQVHYGGGHRRGDIRYDPFGPGGWSFQMFLDTDQRPTGYWLGYDYLTRDSESDLGGRSLRVRRTEPGEESGADGWGDETAVVPLRVNESVLAFRLPLANLADHDGRIDFAFEVYRTVRCEQCPGGRGHEYAYHVFGTSGVNGVALLRRARGTPNGAGHFAHRPIL